MIKNDITPNKIDNTKIITKTLSKFHFKYGNPIKSVYTENSVTVNIVLVLLSAFNLDISLKLKKRIINKIIVTIVKYAIDPLDLKSSLKIFWKPPLLFTDVLEILGSNPPPFFKYNLDLICYNISLFFNLKKFKLFRKK